MLNWSLQLPQFAWQNRHVCKWKISLTLGHGPSTFDDKRVIYDPTFDLSCSSSRNGFASLFFSKNRVTPLTQGIPRRLLAPSAPLFHPTTLLKSHEEKFYASVSENDVVHIIMGPRISQALRSIPLSLFLAFVSTCVCVYFNNGATDAGISIVCSSRRFLVHSSLENWKIT